MKAAAIILALAAAPLATEAAAQQFTQRGFLDFGAPVYPQTAPNDSAHVPGEALFRYEASWRPASEWRLYGSVDARTDTHGQVDRAAHLSWWDRERARPAFEVRRLSALWHRGAVTIEAGKQFIRWGKADILNPTDRFAPRDFLSVVDNDFLAVPAARFTVERGSETLDAVWQARFTPSRIPLFDQRWAVLPQDIEIIDAGARYPGGPQLGVRWNHIGAGYEFSMSFFDGRNHLPLFEPVAPIGPAVAVQRIYPKLRMYGGDAAIPLRPFTLKSEAAYFQSPAGDYALYVVQIEKDIGEWSLVGGYAGEWDRRESAATDFAPDRGLARAFLGRATYTIDATRSLLVEAALRQTGEGVWLRSEYSQSFGEHWRATAGFTLIRGDRSDFLGQYRRNSHAMLNWRYSF